MTAKRRVSVHIRRTDYCILSSLNLDQKYYQKAISFFPEHEYQLVVFSDDIKYCRNLEVFQNRDIIFAEGNSAGVDMYLMSQCDGNIIANSTFSFWGAFLNHNRNRRVVCPRDFIGSEADEVYLNGNYYPEDWIAI